jgi:hypothetical protein
LIASAIRGILSHQQALYLGRAAGPERFCIVAAGIADRLAEPERREVLADALAATAAIRDGNPRAQAFANLAPHLSEQESSAAVADAVAAASIAANSDGYLDEETLASVALHLSESERNVVLASYIEAAMAMHDEGSLARKLAVLAAHLSEHMLVKALAACISMTNELCRANSACWHRPVLERSPSG